MINRNDLIKRYRDGLINIINDKDEYINLLKCMSNIYRYEFKNIVLVYEQRGIVNGLARYDDWKKIGRHVMPGKKSVAILEDEVFRGKRQAVFVLDDTLGKEYEQNWVFDGEIADQFLKESDQQYKNMEILIKHVFDDMIKLGFFTQIEEVVKSFNADHLITARMFILSSAYYVVMLRATGEDISSNHENFDISLLSILSPEDFEKMGALISDISRTTLIYLRKKYDAIKKEIERRRDYDSDTLHFENPQGGEGRENRDNIRRGIGLLPTSYKEWEDRQGRHSEPVGGRQKDVRGTGNRERNKSDRRHDQQEQVQMGQNMGEVDVDQREGVVNRLHIITENGEEDRNGGTDRYRTDSGSDGPDERTDSREGLVVTISEDGTEPDDGRRDSDSGYIDDDTLNTKDNTDKEDEMINVSSSFLSADLQNNNSMDVNDIDTVINKIAMYNTWHAVVYELIRRGATDIEAVRTLIDYIRNNCIENIMDETGVYKIKPCMVGIGYKIDLNSGMHKSGSYHGSQIYTALKKWLDQDKVKCRIDGELYEVSNYRGESYVVESKEIEKAVRSISKEPGNNFKYVLSEYVQLYENRGPKLRFRDNIAAVKLLKELEKYDRAPNDKEQLVLSKFVGWGGLDMVFDSENNSWQKEYSELKNILNDDEYKAARESVNSAFYTSPLITREVNRIISKLGVKTGNVLEPSLGIGNFIGTIDSAFNVSGVELDSITGRIAKKLYPDADIEISGYENAGYLDNEFDAAVGNVPFGNYSVFDKTGRYNDQKLLIHNYFFAKTLDVVKPGGIIAFITSKGTLDQKNPEFRKYIAQRAELVGAIRLPNSAFKAAGTETTSDIIVLQKREHLIGDNEIPDWVYIGLTENNIPVNSYYISNPNMLLGTMRYSGHYNMTECVAEADINIPEKIHDLIEQEFLPEKLKYTLPDGNIRVNNRENVLSDPDNSEQNEDTRIFTHILYNGDVYYRDINGLEKKTLQTKDKNRLIGLIEIKILARKLMSLSMDGANDIEFNRVKLELNKAYDSFHEKYGYINTQSNKRLLEGDIDKYFLLSLEVQNNNSSYSKSDFFAKRTILPSITIDRVDTAQDALRASLSEKGCVDIEYMLSIYKPDVEYEIRKNRIFDELKDSIYRNPQNYSKNNEFEGWETADEYLSGNVREKLRIAEKQSAYNKEFQKNVEALKKVQPQELLAEEINIRVGASWIDVSDYEEFVYEVFNVPRWLRRSEYINAYSSDRITIDHNDITGEYFINNKLAIGNTVVANSTYGTSEKLATELFEDALNQRMTTVRYKIDDGSKNGKYVIDQKETLLAREKQDVIKEKFAEWLWKSQERKYKYVKRYNEQYNSIRLREYDGSMLKFPGMNKSIKLQPHQVNAVARILFGGNTLLAHVVGAGKTYEMIAAIMEQKRLGLATKPCLVVPKPLIEQMASDFMKLYPAANILVATEKDFSANKRKIFISRIATGDFDCVIMSQEQFKKIRISPQREKKLIEKEIEKIDREIITLKWSTTSRHSVKSLESKKKQLSVKLAHLLSELESNADTDNLSFEELGIDALFVDEAHAYKNMPITTKMNVAGISSSNSQAALDMLAKCQYINEISSEHNLVFATGTPVSNTMGELYVMQSYLQPSVLKRAHVGRFDDWAANFGEVVTELEMNVQGNDFRFRNRFSKFVNIPELMTMYKDIADIQTADMLKLPVPEIRGGKPEIVAAKRSEIIKMVMDDFCERADRIQAGSVDPREDNFLKLTNDARLLGTDIRLLPKYMEKYGEFYEEDPGSKLNLAVDNIVKEYEIAKEKGVVGTQLVFSDIGTPKTDGRFTVYDYMKKRLIDRGIPATEVAFIHDADKASDSGKARDLLFEKVRNGDIKVLIGSTNKCGTGVNVQDHCIALHHIDCPWRPADIEQREGRAIRRGNQNSEVAIYRYCTVGTFDAYLWNVVENKQKFISQVMTSRAVTRECSDINDTTLSYAEIKTIATGNPKVKERMILENDVSKLELMKSSYIKSKKSIEDKMRVALPARIRHCTESLENIKKDLAQSVAYPEGEFKMTVSGVDVAERKEAAALYDKLVAEHDRVDFKNAVLFCFYKGFAVMIKMVNDSDIFSDDMMDNGLCAEIRGAGTYTVELGQSAQGNILRIENTVASLSYKAINIENKLDQYRADLTQAQEEYDRPFEQESELVEKRLALKRLNNELELAACSAGEQKLKKDKAQVR